MSNLEQKPKVTEEQVSIGGEAPESDDEECDA